MTDDINLEFWVEGELVKIITVDSKYDLKIRNQLFSVLLNDCKQLV